MSKRTSAIPVLPSVGRQMWNAILCLTCFTFIFLYFRRWVYWFPITFESIWQIALAEINRRKNVQRVRTLQRKFMAADEEKGLSQSEEPVVRQMASVVGYREEPNLYRKCLESYLGSPGLEIMLVGIDGDHDGDMEMVRIAEQVFSDTIVKIHLQEPLGPMAIRLAQNYIERNLSEKDFKMRMNLSLDHENDIPKALLEEARRYALGIVLDKAKETLRRNNVLEVYSPGKLQAICIYQPHKCKKDIMFTNMIFAIALGYANDIEYLWTSDSDTWVYSDTLRQTIGCMAADPLIGGSCCALSIHNDKESVISALGSAAYWSELAITRGQTGAVDAVDCQPGPCAAFRLNALEPILLKWFTQTSLGFKTIINEDRHLTTNLLLNGWKVTFNTQAIASTDTPTTLLRWLRQQIRWARATHIETFQYPQVYSIHGPILFVTAMRRFYGPLIIGVFTIRYVLTGYTVHTYSMIDLIGRIILCTGYNFWCNKDHVNSIFYLIFSQVFYQLPLPGVMFWSVITVLEGGWGTQMRNQSEIQKGKNARWDNLWSTTVVVMWMGFVAAALARFVSYRLAPTLMSESMLLTAFATMGTLYYVLLK